MTPPLRRASALIVFGFVVGAGPAAAQKPSPLHAERYLCPNAEMPGVDCFLHAVEHLYTMCRQVKSIEIIEFGYEKSDEGVNGAKTVYCIDKHNLTMKRTYQSAVHEAGKNRAVVEALHSLHDYWAASLAGLKWVSGESDAQYKARTDEPYGIFRARAMLVRSALEVPKTPAAATAKGPPKSSAAAPAKTKSTN